MTSNQTEDAKDRRREQIRLAQRRRRERLAQGQRIQLDIFLSNDALSRLDALSLLLGIERSEVIERLLTSVEVDANASPFERSKAKIPEAR